MTRDTANDEVERALAKLEQIDTYRRQETVALCAEKAAELGPRFFCQIISRPWDPTCRWYAIRALGDLRAREYSETLLGILHQPDVLVGESSLHRICARSIGFLGEEVIPAVARLLEDSRVQTRAAAADALGEIGNSAAIPFLARSLAGDEQPVQLWAALSLAKIGSESLPALIDTLKTASKETAVIILDALIRIEDSRVVDEIADVANRHPDVLRCFFSIPRAECTGAFVQMLRDIPEGTPLKQNADKILSILK